VLQNAFACTRFAKAGTPRRPCPGSPFRLGRPGDLAPARPRNLLGTRSIADHTAWLDDRTDYGSLSRASARL